MVVSERFLDCDVEEEEVILMEEETLLDLIEVLLFLLGLLLFIDVYAARDPAAAMIITATTTSEIVVLTERTDPKDKFGCPRKGGL